MRPALVTALGAALGAALAVSGARLFARALVEGDSMAPALLPGDRLLLAPAWRVGPGDVVAVSDPRRPGSRVLVKRVASVVDGLVELRGDNRAASTDSRHFGPLPRRAVRLKAVYRYGPPGRAGRLAR